MLFLLLFTSQSWAQSTVGVLSACMRENCSPQSSNSILSQFANQCAIESKALKCDELVKEDSKLAGLIRKCEVADLCAQAEGGTAFEETKACLRGYTNSLIDTGVAIKDMFVGVGSQIDAAWEKVKADEKLRSEFISQCNQSLACKKDLVKEDPRYASMPDEDLEKISATALFVQVQDRKAYLQSISRSVPNTKPPEAHSKDSEISAEQKAKLLDLAAVIKAKLKKEYHKFNCYKPEAQAEMACYAVGQVVDPLLLAGAAFKGARVLNAMGKANSEGSTVFLLLERLEKAAVVTRNGFITKYVDYNPTTVAQNEKFIALAEKGKDAKAYFVNIENSQMKYLNDTLKNKNLVTSLTNYHKELVLDRMKELQKEFPDLKISEYSDFKSLRFAFEGKMPADLEKRIQAIFKDSNDEFVNYLTENKLLRKTDSPETYFRAGVGDTADEAGIASRWARKGEPGELATYSSSSLKSELSAKISSVEKDRVSLRNQLKDSKMLDGETFQPEVFDIVRKNQGDSEKINSALMTRYRVRNLSEQTLTELQRYVKTSDEFSPGLMVAKRENANLNDAVQGGFTMDFVGLGASNMKGTAEALSKSKDLDGVLHEARSAEKAVTEAVNKQKQFFTKVVTESVEKGKLKSICSGDDCVAVATAPLSEQEKLKVLNRVADSKYAAKMRFAFVNDGVKSSEVRNTLSTHGESIEKLLRKNLSASMKANKLEGLTFGVDMRTTSLNEGSVKLLMGQSQDVYLTKSEQARIKEIFKQTVQEFNRTVYKKSFPPRYEAVP
ncbi:hypothetical protein [Bdellovibrio sp. GT3]|uniref:hypothetical protein n=1 Tax=Bdellovibrio sp. GT3 TaxID=3136282 RepID=UPI0030F30CE7